jgi:hypothetical protein
MTFRSFTCRTLVVSLLALSFQTAQAGLITPEQALAGGATQDRGEVAAVMARADTAAQLAALGVDPQQVRERVAALSDAEVSALAQDLRQAPAGADGGGVLLAVILVSAVWYFFFRR